MPQSGLLIVGLEFTGKDKERNEEDEEEDIISSSSSSSPSSLFVNFLLQVATVPVSSQRGLCSLGPHLILRLDCGLWHGLRIAGFVLLVLHFTSLA